MESVSPCDTCSNNEQPCSVAVKNIIELSSKIEELYKINPIAAENIIESNQARIPDNCKASEKVKQIIEDLREKNAPEELVA